MSETLSSERWVGPFRTPRNSAAEVKGSIHDDATAQKLGFRGGTVAGSIHMDQFAPRLAELYGEAWFETGLMSLYFTKATVDAEPVQAVVEPGAERARLSMYDRDGALICQGTASPGPDTKSELAQRFETQTSAAPGALRILAGLTVGDENHDLPVSIAPDILARALETITETTAAYGRGVLPPSHAIRLAHLTRDAVMAKSAKPHVGLFGALEVQHLAGPLMAGVAYRARTKILKLTESPKTENVWYEVIFTHEGRDIARVLYLLRLLKGSSPLWET